MKVIYFKKWEVVSLKFLQREQLKSGFLHTVGKSI